MMSDQPTRSSVPFQLILMLVILISTILAGFLMFPSSQEARDKLLARLGTTNHGTFLQPVRAIADLKFTDDEGSPWVWSETRPKWRLLIPGGIDCGKACNEMLYTTRQVHLRLGKYTHRVERFYLNLDNMAESVALETLATEHPYLKFVNTDKEGFTHWLTETNLRWPEIGAMAILVDPAGVAMMYYTPEHSGNGILEDLNHLLKYSPE